MDIRFQIEAIERQWRVPAGLDRCRPREVRLTGAGKALVTTAVILLVAAVAAGIGLEVVARRQAEDARLWRLGAVEMEGRITRLWSQKGEHPKYWVAYQFSAGTQIREGRAQISRSLWNRLEAGRAVPVRYLPSRPAVNYPFDNSPGTMPRFVPYLAAIVLAVSGSVVFFFLRREWRMLSEGRAAAGLVTRHSKMHRGSHGHKLGVSAYYQFAQLGGSISEGHTDPREKAPAVGSTVCVLYDPEDPRRNVLYPLSLVRPVWTASLPL